MAVSTELTLVAELNLTEIAKAAMEYMIVHPKREWVAVHGGVCVKKDQAQAAGQDKIAIARGIHPEVWGDLGARIGMIVEDEKGRPVAAGLKVVDGSKIKAYQKYTLTTEREWVEV